MQGDYTYWGALFFSYMHAKETNTYAFAMNVDNAARLWVNGTLVIDATCKAPACILPSTPVTSLKFSREGSCTIARKVLLPTMIQDSLQYAETSIS